MNPSRAQTWWKLPERLRYSAELNTTFRAMSPMVRAPARAAPQGNIFLRDGMATTAPALSMVRRRTSTTASTAKTRPAAA